MSDLEKYPNLNAILNGTVSGNFRNWGAIRPELIKLLAEMGTPQISKPRIEIKAEMPTHGFVEVKVCASCGMPRLCDWHLF